MFTDHKELNFNSGKFPKLDIKQHTSKYVPLVKEKSTREIRKHLEVNENENASKIYGMQSKQRLRVNFIALHTYSENKKLKKKKIT